MANTLREEGENKQEIQMNNLMTQWEALCWSAIYSQGQIEWKDVSPRQQLTEFNSFIGDFQLQYLDKIHFVFF
jgi:hypothetical protein